MWQYLKVVIYSFNSFIMYFTDKELQKWKVEDLQKYLLQQGVPTGNNARKANSIHCANSAKPRRRRKGYFKYKAQIEHWWRSNPNNIKENCITGSEHLPNIVLKNIDEYAELNSAKKASKEGRNLLFSGHAMSVKFNPIFSCLKYCFVKGVVIPQTRANENPYSVWICIFEDGSILTGECGCVAGLISSCKHVFTILHYIESKEILGHNKTCTSKKQKWDVRVYRKRENIHLPTKIGNVSVTATGLEPRIT